MSSARERLETLLARCAELGASDLHLAAGEPVAFRRDGDLSFEGSPLAAEEVTSVACSPLNDLQRAKLESEGSVDLALKSRSVRFRLNVFKQRGGIALAARRFEDRIRSLEELNLPRALESLTELRDGLVLVTGPVGSGKTTTLATLIHAIYARRPCHVLTIEDPVEYLHRGGAGIIRQREVHVDVPSFATGLRAALREDPDVILIGELRDADTVRAAIMAAETGHLVYSTLHCGDAVGAIDRLVGALPSEEQGPVRVQLSMVLRAVIAQRLLKRADGPGRVPAVELLLATTAVANLIRTSRPQAIYTAIETGAAQGMQTLEQSLAELVAKGLVRIEDARRLARDEKALDDRARALRGRVRT